MEREKTHLSQVLNASGSDVVEAADNRRGGALGAQSTCEERTERGYVPTINLIGGDPGEQSPDTNNKPCERHHQIPFTSFHDEQHVDATIRSNNNNDTPNGVFEEVELQTLIAETQEEGPWPAGHPLPLPVWSAYIKQPYYTATIWQYEELATNIELNIQHLLEDHNYNTIGNFLNLYNEFKKSGNGDLEEFFHSYEPIVSVKHHTCVGLALELWRRLEKLNARFPGLSDSLYLTSCEECIESLPEYVDFGDHLDVVADTLEKEHVLLALKINVAGRTGVLLCDPGYHVARVITVMKDRAYPHTGWFTQSEETNLRKEYNYSFSKLNSKYVEWSERETRNGIQKTQISLIFISRPYVTAVDVTERRNLVYDFRSLLSRDTKGHLIAGVYFKVKPEQQELTLFYQSHGRQRVKIKFDSFLKPQELNDEYKNIVKECNQQLNLPDERLTELLHDLAVLMSDVGYVHQLLHINNNVNTITEPN